MRSARIYAVDGRAILRVTFDVPGDASHSENVSMDFKTLLQLIRDAFNALIAITPPEKLSDGIHPRSE